MCSIGAIKVKDECTKFQECCKARDGEGYCFIVNYWTEISYCIFTIMSHNLMVECVSVDALLVAAASGYLIK